MGSAGDKAGRQRDYECPICSKPAPAGTVNAPFCSERCKMVDLGRWFRGEYVVAGEAAVAFDPELIEAEEARRDRESSDAGERGGPPESEA